ncbi:type III-B CRISPR-associated protein Cas10/Cmr2 [Hoeflea sp.]|uniref:type III-B CRISPR-associated protein Cas10/Cmr2 n=1 Tax=Hoeflea sp. TaxID=1940281 RepID=UPI003B011093
MTTVPLVDWEQLIIAYLCGPIDSLPHKKGDEEFAVRQISAALGRTVSKGEIEAVNSTLDRLFSASGWLPLPSADEGPKCDRPTGLFQPEHTLSGHELEVKSKFICEVISRTVEGLETSKQRFFALWRILPSTLVGGSGDRVSHLPADARMPDHSNVEGADSASGLLAGTCQGMYGYAYLSVALKMQQPFTETASSVQDLWAGNAIMSWLAFKAMEPVIDRFGPASILFPSLRENPYMDIWLHKRMNLKAIPTVNDQLVRMPSLPNRFLALVPCRPDRLIASELAALSDHAAREAWTLLAANVRHQIGRDLSGLYKDWDRSWRNQIENVLDVTSTVILERELDDDVIARHVGSRCFGNAWLAAAEVRSLATSNPPDHRSYNAQASAGRWRAHMEILERVVDANCAVRHIPRTVGGNSNGSSPKCSQCGSFEQMGPAEASASNAFWSAASSKLSVNGTRLLDGEHLCAIALTRRFAGPAFLASEFGVEARDLRMPDTATIAAADWLQKSGMDPSELEREYGHWKSSRLHRSQRHKVVPPPGLRNKVEAAIREYGQPPTHFAVLKMNGDDTGDWLCGRKAPGPDDVVHPAIENHGGQDYSNGLLRASRPAGPCQFNAVTAILGQFTALSAPQIIQHYNGAVIFSRGDEILALLPALRAVNCVNELHESFKTGGRRYGGKGKGATISAGISYVHYKDDLRRAIYTACEAQKWAKDMGKDLVCVSFNQSSGPPASAPLPWSHLDWFANLTSYFTEGTDLGRSKSRI